MTVYLAFEIFDDFNHGISETCYGVYSTFDKAKAALERNGTWYNDADWVSHRHCEFQYGQDLVQYIVEPTEIDRDLVGGDEDE